MILNEILAFQFVNSSAQLINVFVLIYFIILTSHVIQTVRKICGKQTP